MIRKFAIFVMGIYIRFCYGHKVYGLENLPQGGGIVAPNHASYLDPPIVGISAPKHMIHFLARKSLFKFKPFGWLIEQLKTHPVSPGKGNLATFKTTIALLKSGKKVVIFPEGTRSRNGSFRKGQLGVGMLVKKAECQVIPVYIHGTYEIWNIFKKLPKLRGHTACVFGKPIDFSEMIKEGGKETQQRIADTIMKKIEVLQTWYLEGHQGTPP